MELLMEVAVGSVPRWEDEEMSQSMGKETKRLDRFDLV
jgi:hypothetical protein